MFAVWTPPAGRAGATVGRRRDQEEKHQGSQETTIGRHRSLLSHRRPAWAPRTGALLGENKRIPCGTTEPGHERRLTALGRGRGRRIGRDRGG